MTMGKCIKCKIKYIWKSSLLLRNARCNKCGSNLYQTTYILGTGANRQKYKIEYAGLGEYLKDSPQLREKVTNG